MATVFMNWMKNVSERRENRTKNGKKREKAENPKEDEKNGAGKAGPVLNTGTKWGNPLCHADLLQLS